MSKPGMSRRQWLGGGLMLALAPRISAQPMPGAPGEGRLVVVFLRGAVDGLSLCVPYTDPDYPRLRPGIALPAPDGTAQSALRLDARFALHPALAGLLPLWQQGRLAIIPASGSPDPTRSHFEAQYYWETARPGRSGDAAGWLNQLGALAGTPGRTRVLGVGEANPRILTGSTPVKLIARGRAAQHAGALQNDAARQALLGLYAGADELSRAFQQGAQSRLQTAQDLAREMQAANNGAAPAAQLQQDARNLGALMRQEHELRIGFLSAGGWDTHANQGAATGLLANNLRNLDAALMQLAHDFDRPGDIIVMASEFGRTVAENGSRGTDHGHGNAMWLIGPRIAGGRCWGEWGGLAAANLHERRDLPVHHDFRAVLAQVLTAGFDLSDSQLASLLPGAGWDARLDGLVRRR